MSSLPLLITILLAVLTALCIAFGVALRRVRRAHRVAEGKALASEQRLSALLAHGKQILVEVDEAGLVLGRFGTRKAGWEDGQIDGVNLLDLVHPDDRPEVKESIAAWRQMGPRLNALETRGLQADGTYRWYETSTSNFVGNSGEQRLYVVSRDIQDRKMSELALRESERRYRSMADQSPLGVLLVDQDMDIVFANVAYAELVGAPSVEDLNARNVWSSSLLATEQSLDVIARVASGESVKTEFSFTSKYEKAVEASAYISPLQDEHGAVIGGQILLQDVSQSRRLEEQLHHAQKMRAVGQLAGGIAHDFNNYLTVILASADSILERAKQDKELHQAGREIIDVAERCAVLTESLLTFSRRRVARSESIDLDQTVGALEPMIRRLLGESIEIEHLKLGEETKIWFDPALMEQVILNLVMNAADAMTQGDRLTIEVRGGANFARGDMLASGVAELVIRDTGCGMDPETLNRACEPFFTTKAEGHGTGLGLSTVYGIVEQAGGTVELRSEIGQGTSFHIVFPEGKEGPVPVEKQIASESLAETGHERILLVEDESTLRNLTHRILLRAGYSVIEASDGQNALDIYRELESPPDLVLSDIVMPRLSGADLAHALRAEKPDLPILFMSGYYSSQSMKVSALPPNVEVLAKPFSVRKLRESVRKTLDSSMATA
jgi:two-component system cell cycle sensor histidine kinase/response regulator CckA